MVADYSIKETIITAFNVNGSVTAPLYTLSPVNGEILKIQFSNITSPGSLWVAFSGTNVEVYRKNDFTSGLAAFEVYPQVFAVDAANATGSPNNMDRRVSNAPLYIAGSGFTSGTAKTFGPVSIFYR